MAELQHIGKRESRAARRGASLPSLSGLPPEMLEEASRRLGTTGLVYAVVYSLAYYGASLVSWATQGNSLDHLISWNGLFATLCILDGVVVWLAVRHLKIEPHRLLDFGLIFLVLGSLGISLPQLWGVYPNWDPDYLSPGGYIGIPWECIWIIIYPIIAPNSTRKMLVAALLAAAMPFLVLMLSKHFGPTDSRLPLGFFFSYYLFSTFLCAFVAVWISRLVMRHGARLRRAQEMGQYKLTRLIGRGGMGEVWEAQHRMLARPAAVKLIRPDSLHGDDSARLAQLRRFEREARATATLRSVHSIDIYDFGLTADASFYYVMELLEGLDMDSFVKRFGPVTPARTIFWLRQACHALIDAHARGLIHRDLKPANLYVCRLGPDCDFVKVLDYGLVKDRMRELDGGTQLTREGLAFGTPGYMAPEMAMGAAEADARSDLYALGCLGYFLLTGAPVFEGETALATVLMHVKDAPLPPSRRSETPLPADLEALILDCLAKEPGDRPADAATLDARLAACADAGAWGHREACDWWDLHLPGEPGHGLPAAAGPTDALL